MQEKKSSPLLKSSPTLLKLNINSPNTKALSAPLQKREVTDHKGESLLWFRFQMFFKEDNSKGIPIKIKYTSVQSIAMRR